MRPRACVSKEGRVRVTVLAEEGQYGHQIAESVGCNKSTVARILAKYRETGSIGDLPRSGRPKKTSSSQDRVLRRISFNNRHLMSPDLLSEWSKNATWTPRLSQHVQCVEGFKLSGSMDEGRGKSRCCQSLKECVDWPGQKSIDPGPLNSGGKSFFVTKATSVFMGIKQTIVYDVFRTRNSAQSVSA